MSVVVTGGSGVVGAALLRHLGSAGFSVDALSRSRHSDEILRRLGAKPVRGDIEDSDSLRSAFAGADLVFHVAGLNTMCPDDPNELERVNVGGTRNVITAADAAGVRRVVYTSSAAAIGEEAGTVGSEDSVHRGSYLSQYERSKHLAELAAFETAVRVEVIAVNPSSVQGPGRATGTGKLILDLLGGRLPALIDTNLSIVDIDDCAHGHLLAASRGVAGERYVLNSFTMSTRDAVSLLEEVTGSPLSVRWVPGWLATVGVVGFEAAFRLARRTPPFCREMVATMRHGHSYDGSRAATDLGLAYTDARDVFGRLVEWFRKEGLL